VLNVLLDRISPHFRNLNVTKARNSSGSPISVTTRLALTLRWLASGSYLDLCFAWGVSSSTFYHADGVLWPTVQALDREFSIGFPLVMREDWRSSLQASGSIQVDLWMVV
jgi:hypothetical protein